MLKLLIVTYVQLDSLLGATLQETLYNKEKKIVVHSRETGAGKDNVASIGGLPVLSNNAVSSVH